MKAKNIAILIATSISLAGCCVEPAPRHSQPGPYSHQCPRVYSQPFCPQPHVQQFCPQQPVYQTPCYKNNQNQGLIYQGPAKPAPPIPQSKEQKQINPEVIPTPKPEQKPITPIEPNLDIKVPEAPSEEIIPLPKTEKTTYNVWKAKKTI